MPTPAPRAPSPFGGPWPHGEDLVAWGGRLAPELVLDAYRHGVFPWYEAEGPVLWWSPDPRAILPLDALHVSRRLARTLRRSRDEIRVDSAFTEVVRACARCRPEGTWIHPPMVDCYATLHARGHAHSVEIWRDGSLVGGLYGVSVGGLFAAESMFSAVRDASKQALVHLVARLRDRAYGLLDVQFLTDHLARLGCVEIPRDAYLARLAAVRDEPRRFV